MKTGRKTRVFRGLTTVTSSVLALSIAAGPVINIFRTDIDKFLGTHSTAVVTDESAEDDLYTYKSDYTSTTDLLHAISDLGERMEEEGAVLLKNNGALPLTKDETQKVSLLGFSSYYPVQGGDMGSSLVENTGTDADTVDFVKALAARGWKINPTLQSLYEALLPTFSTEVETWGGTATYSHITAPSIGGTFASKEPSQKAMDGQDSSWKDSLKDNNVMIVTLARSGSENGSYLPGEEGVDSSQNLNQTDPLGLSDDERDLIAAAVDAKKANGGKVIVLLNNSSAMEVQEIEDNEGVDAIMQIGLPGGYGFYGVADLLSGDANPSGHLTDTYATDASDSPAAQNYGDFEYTNADPSISMNSEVVEAEGIYTGYKYYETRYEDEVLGQGNADSATGSTDGQAWDYSKEVTYPFGYGLSYTTFSQTLDSVDVDLTGNVTAKITVTNTGSVAGKDVVQLYVSTPYTDYDIEHGVEKAGVQLLDYAKTDVLDPGASQTVTIEADPQYMASWDSTAANALGTTGDYILDAGDYYFAIGNGAHEANVGMEIKVQALTALDHTTEGWFNESSIGSLASTYKERLFKNVVATDVATPAEKAAADFKANAEKNYGSYVDGEYYLTREAYENNDTADFDATPILLKEKDSGTWYICRVDEAVKNSKLRAGSADYYGGESNGDILMEVEYQVSYMLADNTSYTKNSNQYYIKEAALSYHDQAVYDYFKKTFPDLFED